MRQFRKSWALLSLILAIYSGATLYSLEPPLPHYNITISDTHQFVWFRVAKVGTRTILDIFNKKSIGLSVNGYDVSYDSRKYKNYFKFAFVRNPWDRVVSCYCNKVVRKMHPYFKECYDKDFDYFVDFIARQNLNNADSHIRLQIKLFPLNEVHFIGKFENFEADLSLVLEKIGIQNAQIPHKNSSSHDHYSKYYTERTKAIIAKKYREDIKAFGYAFESQNDNAF